MKTSTGRKITIATLLTLLLAGSAFTVGSATVPSPPAPKGTSCSKLDDATLANNVRDALAKHMSARVLANIQITANNRVVTLKGAANFLGTRSRAASLAKGVMCVTRVINKIKFERPAESCVGGQQDCCCPDDGCQCANVCPVCSGGHARRHRRGRR